jgi:retinol-binding protein 3
MRHLPLGVVTAMALAFAVSARALPEQRPVTVTAGQRAQAIKELATLLRARYAIAGVAEAAARAIETKLAAGSYDTLGDARAFGDAVRADLVAATSDKHLDFGPAPLALPPGTGDGGGANAEAERTAWRARIRRANNGFAGVSVLPGNVGYLDVRHFEPADVAGDTLVAAMAFLANVDAVIVDLRRCHGGSAYAMPYFAAYFLPQPTSLFDMEFRGDGFTERFWTLPYVPGKRLAALPLYVLTSTYTFSGAEGFAYRMQVLKRATVVGETTGGGANAGGVLDVPPFFRVWMPMGRPVDRTTHGNWEGTGVVPDIQASAAEALAVAHAAALRALRLAATSDAERALLDRALELAEAALHPVTPTVAELQRLAGRFGDGMVWVEGAQLRFRRGTRSPLLLVPLTPTRFATEAEEPARVEFVLGAGSGVTTLVYTDESGEREELEPRSP